MPEHNLVHPRVIIGKDRRLGYTNNIFGHTFNNFIRQSKAAHCALGGGREAAAGRWAVGVACAGATGPPPPPEAAILCRKQRPCDAVKYYRAGDGSPMGGGTGGVKEAKYGHFL